MNKLPKNLATGLFFLVCFFMGSASDIEAVSVAEQTQSFSSSLNVWEVLQELGTNLSGTAQSFTFRVSTAKSNLDQFDYTAGNSKIYDKSNNNSYIIGCVSSSSNPNDHLRGLTFTTTGVPTGFEDVTIDFSCRNYSFIPGHRYLIYMSNANLPNMAIGRILFASATYSGSSNDYFTGGGLRYALDNGVCNGASYAWNSQTNNSGCNIFTTSKDDLYFVLTNTALPPPPPRLPVIFIPGIGGSELKASQDIIWSKDDGHGGTYSHAYTANEKVWINQDEAVKLGNDDYFDILRLKTDGQTPESALNLTGNLSPFGYGEIDFFFTGMGYVKGTNFFVFPYDWRKDVRTTQADLDSLIEQAKTTSGQTKVNLVVHSMGGLVARYYISDSQKAAKVNKLIELGVPHLGSVSGLKASIYGVPAGRQIIGDFYLGVPASEVKDIFQNLPSAFQLLPSSEYYSLNTDNPSPFRDDRDIDNNKVVGNLNYDQTKSLLSNLSINMNVFNMGEQFHNTLDPILTQTNGSKIYEIVGTAQPTLGQIFETWWITWPINLISKTDEIYINGDDTVPLYSASLKNDSLDISGATKIYYVEQKHSDLVSSNGIAMQTVKSLLNDDNSLPVDVKDQKITLDGEQLSLDDGELDLYDDQNRHCGQNSNGDIEENIPDVTCTTSNNTKHTFVKKKAAKVKVVVTRKNPTTNSKTTNLKKRTYKQDQISKTAIYKDIPISTAGKVEFTLDPTLDTSPILTYYPDSTKPDNTSISSTSEVLGNAAFDQTSPTTLIQISGTKDSSGIYTGPVTVTLTGNDSGSGILRIEYSLDNGQTVQTYTEPFTISTPGKTTIQIKSIDKSGNEEIPQTTTIEIAPAPTPTPTPALITTSSSSTNNSDSGTNTSSTSDIANPAVTSNPSINSSDNAPAALDVNSSLSKSSSQSDTAVLGVTFTNPSHISDAINVSHILDQQKNPSLSKATINPAKEILSGLLIVSGGIVTLASLGLITTFTSHTSLLKPFPK